MLLSFRRLPRRALRRLAIELGVLIEGATTEIAKRTLPQFGNNPRNLRIDLPRRIVNPERIYLGHDVWLGPGCLLIAITRYPTAPMRHPGREEILQRFDSRITIGSRVTCTGGLIVAAVSEVTIGDDVLLAANVNITDGSHGYEIANEAYKYQGMSKIAPISVQRGCWIGQNVVVLSGVTIGEFAIIGANSVVTESIPDRCIAVGAPARVIKVWDEGGGEWVPPDGQRREHLAGKEAGGGISIDS